MRVLYEQVAMGAVALIGEARKCNVYKGLGSKYGATIQPAYNHHPQGTTSGCGPCPIPKLLQKSKI